MGPFSEGSDEWRSSTIVIKKYGARITIASIDGSIRGLLHGSKRPDTIFCDDLESLSSVQTLEARDKLYGFFTGDLLPAGDKNTRTIVLGTRLNEDSLIMRLQEDIERGRRAGIFRSYPLVDSVGNILWKAKFPDMAAVEAERLRIGNEDSWSREFLLRPLSKSSRVIWPEWIAYYDEYPDKDYIRGIFVGVDLAIGQNENNDFTSMVTILRCGLVDDMKIYIISPVFNERVTYPEAIDQMRELAVKLRENKVYEPQFVIETNHFQEIYAATMITAGFTAISMKSTIPKRTRRSLVSKLFQERRVLFPREGAERLILQLTDLDRKHDDAADALVIALLHILEHLETDRSQETMERHQGLKWFGNSSKTQRSENK
jgi:phage terminase large subunit-like protein